ncbi:MAG: T9SS type A sorting domain-containing protein [Bacteroidetes bacterium]|nr:T9SS type A sorting domain-containing protein [Bacteroidota bacterium]
MSEVFMIDVKEPENGFAEVVDAEGRLMMRCELAGGLHEVNCSSWPPGNYMVRIVSQNRRVVYPLVKQ